MALITLKEYWWSKLKAYYDAGILVRSGIQCPQCALELWTTAPLPLNTGIEKEGTEIDREVKTYPAVCQNGHQTRL